MRLSFWVSFPDGVAEQVDVCIILCSPLINNRGRLSLLLVLLQHPNSVGYMEHD